ncbi:ABC transporter substrate-binding protein [Erwiniaceae bacterium BAC15a-03b]|uniref:ABC transporter substrate-binding protein n=1 Tax=Winslowiella arboricola TaxID=2978220 RepID=A0A9J6PJJ8_9GAMM|nr:ABC transporter substrate-binding protein [Winslowiella arboricola]MCU5773604.1 ABC transporter substrate-binding protein [Winslowiella arboricola]MCU5778497.1 ABC transporter substrate-binding protein [Winslowiella arboricola]
MKLSTLMLPLLMAGSLSSAWAAEQNVPAHTTFNVTADNQLKSKLPEDILKRGYILAGTNPNTPPTTFYQEDNKTLAGREIDIMSAVAARLGVAVHWQDTGGFDNIIPGLKSGRYDVALSNINATKKRMDQVDFVSYYDASRLGVISRKDANIAPFTSFLEVCGKEIGAGAGTTQLTRLDDASKACQAAGKQPIKIAVFPDRPSGVQAVVSGRVPLFFGPYEGLTWQVQQVKPLTMSGEIHVNDAPVSIAFPKASPLEEAVQASLNSLIKDGTYQKILEKWSIGFGAVKEAKRNEEIL